MIEPGLKGRKEIMVTYDLTAAAMGNAGVEVYATPYMISLIEFTCAEALMPLLEEGQATVGVHLDVSHLGATPVGHKVWCEAELKEVKGSKLLFEVKVFDEKGQVGGGTHLRAIVPLKPFLDGIKKKWAE